MSLQIDNIPQIVEVARSSVGEGGGAGATVQELRRQRSILEKVAERMRNTGMYRVWVVEEGQEESLQ